MQKLKNWLAAAGIIVFLAVSFRAIFTNGWDVPSNVQALLVLIFGAVLAVEPIQEGLKRRSEKALASDPLKPPDPIPPAPAPLEVTRNEP